MISRIRPILGLVALLALASARPARADFSYSVTGSLRGAVPPFTDRPVDVAAFDPTRGTLTGVSVSFSLESTDQVTVFGSTSSPTTYQLSETTTLGVTLGGDSLYSGMIVGSGSVTVAFPDQASTTLSASTMFTSDFSDPAGLALFAAPGPVSFLVSGSATASYGGANVLFALEAVNGDVTVTYTYTSAVASVPGPASLTLLASGLLAAVPSRKLLRR